MVQMPSAGQLNIAARHVRPLVAVERALADTVVFPNKRVHGYTDESIVVDTAVCSGVEPESAEAEIPRFHEILGAGHGRGAR